MKVDILDIFNKVNAFNKKAKFYENGEDNAYPERLNRLIENSVTGTMASNIFLNYVLGSDVSDFVEDFAYDLLINQGVFVHFDFVGDWENEKLILKPTNPKVLPFERCRVGKRDSKEYAAKILYKKDWSDTKEKHVTFDVFNENENVIQSQIKKAGGIKNYKGQVLFINLYRNKIYPLSRLHAVMNDLDSESQAGFYRNQILRKGFFGKQLILTPPLISNDEPQWINDETGRLIVNPLWREKNNEADQVKETIESFIGAENSGGAMLIQMPDFEGKIDDLFQIKKIESNVDDKMFEYTENRVLSNILMAFNNLPIGLVRSPDGALFGNSGESIKSMQVLYQKNVMREKKLVEKFLNFVYSKVGQEPLILKNLIDDTDTNAGDSTTI